MKNKFIIICTLLSIFNTAFTKNCAVALSSQSPQEKASCLSSIRKDRSELTSDKLPIPYDYLLTQPLMTKGIENYYQRTPIIKTIYAMKSSDNKLYSRAITMLIDPNKTRNFPELARKKKEAIVVELAFITMNFKELPETVTTGVLKTNTPFGTLLSKSNVKILTTNRTYFSTKCYKKLSSLTRCKLNSLIYGRTNTIVRSDNSKWLAHVVEILPGFLSHTFLKKPNKIA